MKKLKMSFKKRIHNLTKQVQTFQQKNSGLENQIKEIEQKLNNAEIEESSNKTKLSSLELLYSEAQKELKNFHEVVRVQVEPKKPAGGAKKGKIAELTGKLSTLERQIQSQNEQIKDLTRKDAEQTLEFDNQNRELSSASLQVSELQESNDQLNRTVEDLRNQLEKNVPPTADELVPRSVFHSNQFDTDLNGILDRVTSQHSSAANKVQVSLSEVGKYYNHLIRLRDKEIERTLNDVAGIREAFNQFLIDLSIALTGKAVTFDEFFSRSDAGSEIADTANKVMLELTDLRKIVKFKTNLQT